MVDTVFTMCGTNTMTTAMTTRMTRPQTARPVAVSAGLRRSTVSVNDAIHGANAMPRNTEMPISSSTKVPCDVMLPGWLCVASIAKSVVKAIEPRAPTIMNGFRTPRMSEMTPTISSARGVDQAQK